ncbi:MAG: hypothetical protein ACI8X5_004062 [Planctomycetota bacterium]|jgi:hypothetical protein
MNGGDPAKNQTRIVAGIDEAGLGSMLGPLTMGFSVMRLPLGDVNVWDALGGIVSEKPTDGSTHIIVADSKKVYARNPRGRQRLETTALTFLGQRKTSLPKSGAEILRSAATSFRPRAADIKRHIWYGSLPKKLPIWVDSGRLELRSEALRRELLRTGIELVDCGARVIPAGQLNRSFDSTRNKGTTVWLMLRQILQHIWLEYGQEGVHLIIDRQGGRYHYGHQLQGAFPGAQMLVGLESPKQSEYRLEENSGPGTESRTMRVTFAERAEDRAFTVALGSCMAKFAREIAMEAFNSHFQAIQPDLKPTAGYTTDGRRWIKDAAKTLESQEIDRQLLIRKR